MKLLDERTQVREVARRWKDQYFQYGKWYLWSNRPASYAEDMYKRLCALDVETATAADVERCGLRGWISPQPCHECRYEGWDVVQLGEEPDYDSATARVCRSCLEKALRLARGVGDEHLPGPAAAHGQATGRQRPGL